MEAGGEEEGTGEEEEGTGGEEEATGEAEEETGEVLVEIGGAEEETVKVWESQCCQPLPLHGLRPSQSSRQCCLRSPHPTKAGHST